MNEHTQTLAGNSNLEPSTASQTMDRMANSAHAGIDSASKAVHPGIDRMAASAHKAVDSADDMANQATEALEKAGIKSEELLNAGASYLRDHPFLTLGLAATAGYALSRLLASR